MIEGNQFSGGNETPDSLGGKVEYLGNIADAIDRFTRQMLDCEDLLAHRIPDLF
jgi:hypothetical protein